MADSIARVSVGRPNLLRRRVLGMLVAIPPSLPVF